MVDAASQGGGFTPGFASVLTCADGSRHFVKAASTKAQKLFAGSYREEARKLQALPPGVPAPRLLWLLDDDWVVLGIEYVEGRTPRRPWRQAELDACLDALELVARELTPSPPELDLVAIADEMASWPEFWNHVAATRADLPHLADAAALAAGFADGVGGETRRAHRRARRQHLDPALTALQCSATGTGPPSARPGSTPSSCSSARVATASTSTPCWLPGR